MVCASRWSWRRLHGASLKPAAGAQGIAEASMSATRAKTLIWVLAQAVQAGTHPQPSDLEFAVRLQAAKPAVLAELAGQNAIGSMRPLFMIQSMQSF